VDMVLALTRLAQGTVPSLRAAAAARLGTDDVDALEAECRRLVLGVEEAGWHYDGDDHRAWPHLAASADACPLPLCSQKAGARLQSLITTERAAAAL